MVKKFDPKIFTKLSDDIKNSFEKAVDAKFMKELGGDISEQIRKRTRLGKGCDEDGGQQTSLGNVTPKWRDTKKKRGYPYKKLKKQLSATGQMLDAIDAKDAKAGSVTIYFKGERNKRIASYHDKIGAGRRRILSKFFRLTQGEKNKVTRKITKRIREFLKKIKLR